MSSVSAKRDSVEYQIGWITALDIELAAATALLDELHDEPHDFERGSNDHNVYTWGQVSGHNIILASLPEGKYGLISAATVVERLLSSMPHVKLGLLVGIGAGLPESGLDIRLGDVAVSCPEGNSSGVLQYDFGKEKLDGFQRVGMLAPPPDALLHALRKLRANHEIQDSKINEILERAGNRHKKFRQKYVHPGPDKDHLFSQVTTDQNSEEVEVLRPPRSSLEPEVHYGTIISGNRLIKTATKRCEVAAVVGGTPICLEMEAAGLMNSFPCLVIRGISDYADAHKNDEWQRYAAATASAFAKELLTFVPRTDVARLKDMKTHLMQSGVDRLERVVQVNNQKASAEKLTKFLQSIYPYSYEERKNRNLPRVTGTCEWFVSHPTFRTWLHQNLNQAVSATQESVSNPIQSSLQHGDQKPILWVSADPGCGKSVLVRYLIDQILPASHQNIYYFFFKDDFPDQGTSINAVKALLHQLISQHCDLLGDLINKKVDTLGDTMIDSFFTMWKIFLECANELGQEVICVLDGLDECQASDRFGLLNEIRDAAANTSKLKFLLSTRPYDDIREAIVETGSQGHTLHLSGESDKERHMISKEIDLVIAYRVDLIYKKRNLSTEERSFLLDHLGTMSHRTYLWAHLTLNIIEQSLGFTKGNVRAVCAEISPKVEAAYEKILNRSIDKAKTLKVLLFVTSTERPLEVGEMQILLALDGNKTKYSELEEFLEPEDRFRITLRNLCGFFVVIINSKVYLLHQTAREFLLSRDYERSNDIVCKLKLLESSYSQASSCSWGRSISLQIAHVAMVIQSKRFLALDGSGSRSLARRYLELYCKQSWLAHLEYADIDYTDIFLDWIVVAIVKGSTWYQAIRYPEGPFDESTETVADYQMQVGTFAGLACLVKRALLITYSEIPSDVHLFNAIKIAVRLQATESLQILLAFAAGIILKQNDLGKIRQKIFPTLISLSLTKLVRHISTKSWNHKRLEDILTASQLLLLAVQENNTAALQLLLACGVNVHAVYGFGRSLLHFAGEPLMAKMLLDAGADPEAYDIWDVKPLICHFQRSHIVQQCKAMQELLWTGKANDLLRYYELYGYTSCKSRLMTPLQMVIQSGNTPCVDCVRFILKHYDGADEVTPQEQSLLNYAKNIEATAGFPTWSVHAHDWGRNEAINQIIEIDTHGPWNWNNHATTIPVTSASIVYNTTIGSDHNSENIPSTRPAELFGAIVCRKPIKHLMRLIRNQAAMDATDVEGRTFLHCAIMYGCALEIVRLLIETGTDINKGDRTGATACHYAIRYSRHLGTVKLLIKMGADINKGDCMGATACHYAVRYNHPLETVKLLIENGANVNKVDYEMETACYWAIRYACSLDIIKLLVFAGHTAKLTPIYATFKFLGFTFGSREVKSTLIYAIKARALPSIIQFLIENGLDVNKTDSDGTPIYHAISLRYKLDIIRLLIENGADIRTIGQGNQMLLVSAFTAYYNCDQSPGDDHPSWIEVLKLLLENGTDINAVDSYQRTTLYHAIDHGFQIDLISFLLDNAADVNIPDINGTTVLMVALQKSLSLRHIRLLIDNGADVNFTHVSGETVMHCAILARSDQEVFSLLLENGTKINDLYLGRTSTLQLAASSSLNYHCIRLLFSTLMKLIESYS